MLERSKALRQVGRGDEQPGTGIACNVLDFANMEPGIDRNRTEARGPAGEQQFEKFPAILHAQHDAVAGFEIACGETARQTGDATDEFSITPGVETVAYGRGVRLPAGDIEQQRGEVHCEPVPMRRRDP